MERFDQPLASPVCGVAHFLRFDGIHREWLFTKHVFATLHRSDRPFGVLRGRQRVVHEVNLGSPSNSW
jgi:hypothetical protein